MTLLADIKQHLEQDAYLLDGSDEDIPSYGKMVCTSSIERAIELTQDNEDNLSESELCEVKKCIKKRLWEALHERVSVSEEELQKHDYDEYDWESRDWLYRDLDDNTKFAINKLIDTYISEDPQATLLEIIRDASSLDARYFAAKELEELDGLRVRDNVEPVIIKCFENYDHTDRPYGREAHFFSTLSRVITERLLWSRDIEDMLKRTRQFEVLNNYAAKSARTVNWYISVYQQSSDEEEKKTLLEALAFTWEEKGNLMPFLIEQEEQPLTPGARAQVMKCLFLNFPYHQYTIEKLRNYLSIFDEDSEEEQCELWFDDQQTMLDSYSDTDLPQKRDMLELAIGERHGDLHRSIEIYTRSYGLTDATFAFFKTCLENAKEGHKTGLLNLFLRNFPDTEQTEEIRRRYKRLM